ncbi:MAG: electron transfer flavoprotein subunit alpha [Solirubrobacterales bacterium 70-9]|nr:MAG: electron transfer flavoprotein subunit alpha [Solirubrobacterales bacterium 70-9]
MTYPDDAVLVLLDLTPSGDLASTAPGLLGAASAIGSPVALVIAGSAAGGGAPGSGIGSADGDPAVDAVQAPADRGDALAQAAAELGAVRTLVAESGDAVGALTVPAVDALQAAANEVGADVVLASHSIEGREVAARFAARTKAALAVDVVGLARDEEGAVVRHSAFGGAYATESAATFGTLVVTVRPGAIEERAEAQPPAAEALTVAPSGKPAASIASFEERVETSSRPALREAAAVVSFGVALGSPDRLPVIEELADSLDAALGASRAAVDEGYAPQSWQVGQTGVSVSPSLYVAIGISGATQHRVGMQTAKTIVAINKDPDAPIFDIADFGVVGDQFTIVPQLTEAIRARKA